MKRFLTYFAILTVATQAALANDRLYFNDLKVPENRQDVEAIQDALQENLEKARAATVCVKLAEGSGSGVIVSEDGLVFTAAHVASGVKKSLKVIMEDGREYEAITLGLNSNNDAAMMQIISEEKFPYVEIEEADENTRSAMQLGDWVFSLGHSGGFDKDRGSVVRLGRMVRIAEDTMRTDCLLIGGDSGGPLFDINGVLVGIHSRVGGHASQNLHVPVQVFHKFNEELKSSKFIGDGPFAKKSEPGSGFIGIALKEVDAGLEVIIVEPGYPAEKAGVKVGDVLIEFNGKKLSRKKGLRKLLKKLAADDRVEMKYLRKGGEKVIELTLKTR